MSVNSKMMKGALIAFILAILLIIFGFLTSLLILIITGLGATIGYILDKYNFDLSALAKIFIHKN